MCNRSSQWILRIILYGSWWILNEHTRKIWKSLPWLVSCVVHINVKVCYIDSRYWHKSLLLALVCMFVCVVRSFVIAGRGPACFGPQRWDLMLVQCASSGQEGNWLMYVSVCVTCRVKDGLSRSEQLVGYLYSVPPLCVAYCLAKRQPEDFATSICFGSRPRGNTLTLLIKASAAVTVYRGHRWTFFPPGIIALFIMWIGIIRSTPPSRPNKAQMSNVRPPARPSVHKKFLRFQWNSVCR